MNHKFTSYYNFNLISTTARGTVSNKMQCHLDLRFELMIARASSTTVCNYLLDRQRPSFENSSRQAVLIFTNQIHQKKADFNIIRTAMRAAPGGHKLKTSILDT